MILKNRIAECDDGKLRPRDISKLQKIIVHRIEEELGHDAPSLAKAFKDTTKFAAGSYTGGEMPYTFVLCTNGVWEQALALGDIGPHAMRYNAEGVGLAIIGDFRHQIPTAVQWVALVEFCVMLVGWRGQPVERCLFGHDELPGASSDPNKECPGKHIDMNELRNEVRWTLTSQAVYELKGSGVVF